MLFALTTICALISLAILMFKPSLGVLATILLKPIVDTGYKYNLLFNFSVTEIVGVAVPTLLIGHMLLSSEGRPQKMPLFWIWAFYIFANFLAFTISVSHGKFQYTLDTFFRILNGFVGFYLFQTYFAQKERLRKLLIAYLLAGIFPMIMGLYQAITGEIWHMRTGTLGIVRNVGLYHNAMSFRFFSYMTLTALILYWSYFSKKTFFQGLLFLAYAAICGVVIFKIYSKAALITMGLWVLIWSVGNRKYTILLYVGIAFIIVNLVTGNRVLDQIGIVFFKETAVLDGEMHSDMLLSGRMISWKAYLDKFFGASLFHQLFGLGASWGGGHNDYLRALISSGVIGLMTYLFLLGSTGLVVTRKMLQSRSPLTIMAFMIFVGYIIDTIGLAPGLYTNYQWYAWGFMGLAIHGVDGLAEETPDDVAVEPYPFDRDYSSPWDSNQFS